MYCIETNETVELLDVQTDLEALIYALELTGHDPEDIVKLKGLSELAFETDSDRENYFRELLQDSKNDTVIRRIFKISKAIY